MDERYMRLALGLALKGAGRVSPNPMVGAVVAKGGRVVGRGYHRTFGEAHAEVEALRRAGRWARGAALYVILEPCCHYGKTLPCTDAILEAGIRRVVVGTLDPNPLVSGKGIEQLKKGGVQVESGLLGEACRRLNEAFTKYVTTGLPFVTLKLAATLDGRIATAWGQSQWITGPRAREMVQELRGQADAVMVGVGTIIADDPILTYRGKRIRRRRPLLRVVVDSRLRTSPRARVVTSTEGAMTLIAATREAPPSRARRLEAAGAEVLRFPPRQGRVDLAALLKELGRREIASLLIEGGSALATACLEQRLVDKLLFFYAPKIMGGEESLPMFSGKGAKHLADAIGITGMVVKRVGDDLLVQGYLTRD